MPTDAELKKTLDVAKLVATVVLLTVLLIGVLLNFQTRQPINLIFGKMYVFPALTIMVSFGLGMLFMLLLLLIRRARRR